MNDDILSATATPVVSVVLPARNAAATIGAQLEAVVAQFSPVPFEVIVVDSASSDGTGRIAAQFPAVRVVRVEQPGANRARNVGVDAALGRVVLLCDADDVVHAGWLAAMYDASQHADYFGGPIELDALNDSDCRAMWGVRTPQRVVGNTKPFPSPIGCNCGFTRELWTTLGGFDKRLSFANEECEFFWRAGHRGFLYADVPTAIVSYRLRVGAAAILRKQFRDGRADVRMHRVAAELGPPRESLVAVLRVYGWMIKKAFVGVVKRHRRWGVLRMGARRLGRLFESVRTWTWYP